MHAVEPGVAGAESTEPGGSPSGDEQGDEAQDYEEFGHGSYLSVV